MLLLPALALAITDEGTFLLAVLTMLLTFAILWWAPQATGWMGRRFSVRNILLLTGIGHTAVLIVLIPAIDNLLGAQNPWASAPVVLVLSLLAGASAPVLPRPLRSTAVNRLSLVLAVVLGFAVGLFSTAGVLGLAAVLSAATTPVLAVRLPAEEQDEPPRRISA
ncbi:hypothetical protein GCM10009771_24230 [Nesterenkonia flava]